MKPFACARLNVIAACRAMRVDFVLVELCASALWAELLVQVILVLLSSLQCYVQLGKVLRFFGQLSGCGLWDHRCGKVHFLTHTNAC